MESAPRAYRLKAGNAAPPISTSSGTSPRKECSAVYGKADVLAQVVAAARRENLEYGVLPVWFEEATVRNLMKAEAEKNAEELQKDQDRRQQAEKVALLQKEREKADGLEKKRRQDELRAKYSAAARGLSEQLGDRVKELFDPKATETPVLMRELFPQLSAWYSGKIAEGWEVENDGYQTKLLDYGTVQWGGRTLEIVFTQIDVKLKHKGAGEYEEKCFILGVVSDQEFERYRDPMELPCTDATTALPSWQISRKFESRWIIN